MKKICFGLGNRTTSSGQSRMIERSTPWIWFQASRKVGHCIRTSPYGRCWLNYTVTCRSSLKHFKIGCIGCCQYLKVNVTPENVFGQQISESTASVRNIAQVLFILAAFIVLYSTDCWYAAGGIFCTFKKSDILSVCFAVLIKPNVLSCIR